MACIHPSLSAEEALATNHIIYWNYLGSHTEDVTKCRVVCSGIRTGWLNGVIAHSLSREDNLDEVVERIVKYFSEHQNLPFSWWIEVSKEPPFLAEVLAKHKIQSSGTSTGMTLDLKNLKLVECPPQLSIRQVESEKELKEMVVTLANAYHADPQIIETVTQLFWQAAERNPKKVIHFLGRESGNAVTAGSLFISQEVACICHVGTISNARKKGYASFLTYQILNQAKQLGCTSSVLVSTPQGKNLYMRLGYIAASTFHRYTKSE